MINGYVSERFGYRYTVMTCLTLIIGFTAIFFTAKNVIAIQVAEILCGIPWGVFQTRKSSCCEEMRPVLML
jgi:SP family general alpha glucoside:H+ symporter-like MFS transporter